MGKPLRALVLHPDPHYRARSRSQEGAYSMNNADLADKMAEANGLSSP